MGTSEEPLRCTQQARPSRFERRRGGRRPRRRLSESFLARRRSVAVPRGSDKHGGSGRAGRRQPAGGAAETFEVVRGIESKAGEFYREGLEGSEKRAREAARSNGLLGGWSYGSRPVDWYRINELKHSVSEERMEQVREIDGEQAYEKMRRAVEKASQEKARQEKARQVEWARQERARQSRPERRTPERGGPERDFGPSR